MSSSGPPAWPGLPPALELIHPGYNLLSEGWCDMADEPLRIVQRTAQALGLPLPAITGMQPSALVFAVQYASGAGQLSQFHQSTSWSSHAPPVEAQNPT